MLEFKPSKSFLCAIFARRNLYKIFLWPFFCVASAAILWGFVFNELAADRRRIEGHTLGHAAALSRAVAKGLSLSVLHVDELSQAMTSRWEERKGAANLNETARNRILDRQWLDFIGIADRNGRLVVSSEANASNGSVAGEAYFHFHKANPTRDLHIGRRGARTTAGTNTRTNTRTSAIVLTRRLNTADGGFDGVVVVTVKPSYLSSFYDEAIFGKRGYLGIRGTDGEHYTARMGGADLARPLLPILSDITSSADGTRVIAVPDWLENNEKGFVAWQQIAPYRLVVVIGLAGDEVLADYNRMAAKYINGAAVGSWFLFATSIAGTLAVTLLLWRKQQAQETRDAYRLATEGGNEGFFYLRALHDGAPPGEIADFVLEDCNQTGAALVGVTRDRIIGIRLSGLPAVTDFILPSELPSQIDIGRQAMAAGIYQDEWTAASASSFRGVWLERKMVRFGNGLAVTLRDISAAKAHERHLLAMAHEDTLTKLPNRHWLMDYLPDALGRAARGETQLALFFIDIDNFKQINDTLGHAAGDALLHVAAMRLKSEMRPGDSLARLGGDEFTIVLEDIDGAVDAQMVAQRIVSAFLHPIELGCGKVRVGTSIGISLFPGDGQDMDMLLRHADIAMYAAKAAGKGQYCFYKSEQYQTLMNRINSQATLERAVNHDQFVMHYQPRFASASGKMCGIEALVRWQNPERGLLLPQEFIALAEATGLIVPLGKLVMEKVCSQIAQWSTMQLPLVPVSFNISAFEFNESDIPGGLAQCLERHKVPPELLEVELTETALVADKGGAATALATIRGMGVKCLIDDFGTGFSSLSQLQRFDTDVLKIDQSFAAELGRTEKTATFFRAIVSLAHALGMGVVAEGVETAEQLRMLLELECEEVQGYYMCSPVPAAEMAILLEKRFRMSLDAL
ncbi:bifunctional diguanylate cyclase/phosphodiesterase [Massilia glaciei]|uniref:GGDEF domain-containing protein n=1 Tax=Massilia glaciei TaxID=1524097 RepID=A0A2U2HLU7_9BURK|nr:EAL domain-containing protein [Massilia glaciei]PWF48477.1 GGDEF domain-containing protein [Massilia glaciei]